jgi:hypothetical protein
MRKNPGRILFPVAGRISGFGCFSGTSLHFRVRAIPVFVPDVCGDDQHRGADRAEVVSETRDGDEVRDQIDGQDEIAEDAVIAAFAQRASPRRA